MPDTRNRWAPDYAEGWAQTILQGLRTAFPFNAQHMSLAPDDVDATPQRLFPMFHSCYDWHSSAHMQWSAVRLLAEAPDHLRPATRDALVAELDERYTAEHGAVEAAYLRARRWYERPYGWAWAAMLADRVADAAATGSVPEASQWVAATSQVVDAVAENVQIMLARLAYPVRHGVHANTAFALALCHEAFGRLGRGDVVDAIDHQARTWFAADRDAPVTWEPSGEDFLSPALCEADLMRRLMPAGEFTLWLAAFLPRLGTEGDRLLTVPTVQDTTDGKMVHLFGLALSRAWQLRLLAPYLPAADARERVLAAAERQIGTVEPQIATGDFVSTHWLVSFALLAVTATG